jgi:hypothetical protein
LHARASTPACAAENFVGEYRKITRCLPYFEHWSHIVTLFSQPKLAVAISIIACNRSFTLILLKLWQIGNDRVAKVTANGTVA